MFIPDPDPKTATKERGEKKLVALPFFEATNIKKVKNYYIFELAMKKKFGPLYKELIIEFFTQKIVIKL
jgi:hypothetical protein